MVLARVYAEPCFVYIFQNKKSVIKEKKESSHDISWKLSWLQIVLYYNMFTDC